MYTELFVARIGLVHAHTNKYSSPRIFLSLFFFLEVKFIREQVSWQCRWQKECHEIWALVKMFRKSVSHRLEGQLFRRNFESISTSATHVQSKHTEFVDAQFSSASFTLNTHTTHTQQRNKNTQNSWVASSNAQRTLFRLSEPILTFCVWYTQSVLVWWAQNKHASEYGQKKINTRSTVVRCHIVLYSDTVYRALHTRGPQSSYMQHTTIASWTVYAGTTRAPFKERSKWKGDRTIGAQSNVRVGASETHNQKKCVLAEHESNTIVYANRRICEWAKRKKQQTLKYSSPRIHQNTRPKQTQRKRHRVCVCKRVCVCVIWYVCDPSFVRCELYRHILHTRMVNHHRQTHLIEICFIENVVF